MSMPSPPKCMVFGSSVVGPWTPIYITGPGWYIDRSGVWALTPEVVVDVMLIESAVMVVPLEAMMFIACNANEPWVLIISALTLIS